MGLKRNQLFVHNQYKSFGLECFQYKIRFMVLVIQKLKSKLVIGQLVKHMIIMEHMIIKLLELIRQRIIMVQMIIMEHMSFKQILIELVIQQKLMVTFYNFYVINFFFLFISSRFF